MLLRYSKLQKISISAVLLAVLSACSTTVPLSLRPGQGDPSTQLYLRGKGIQQFRCEKDNQGYFWKYLKTEADLYEKGGALDLISEQEPVGKLSATNSSVQTFTHRDGSSVKGVKVLKNINDPNNISITWMRMKAESAGSGNKTFDSIRYILRVDTIGGMPFIACEKSTLGELHDSRFSATYVFWK